MVSDGGECRTRSARSGRSASSRANTRAANFRCGPTARSSSVGRPTSTWSWSRTWFRASTPRSPTDDHVVTIQDLGSTNGTFVNGEKVRKADLKDGDRILIGTSIIKIVFVDGENTSHLTETEARSKMAVAANKRQSAAPKSMAGSIEEIPLPDLLQLLSTSRKSGVLVIHSDRHAGKIFFRKGQIYFGNIENQFNIGPRKALTRMLGWTQGSFELEPPDESAVLEELDDSTEGLLIESMRQLDEYQVAAEKLPELSSPIGVTRPLKGKLRELSPEELDVFQAALEVKTVAALFDHSSLSDLEIAQKLVTLFEKGYLVAG